MTQRLVIEPDLNFIKDVGILGGEDVKKCYQCATCAVVCPISPENRPFPRKEMIAASWGLKDQLVKSADPWLCHNCGDCSTRCPRKAKPADVLAAIRAQAITEYSAPAPLAKALNTPAMLPVLLLVPAVYIVVMGFIMEKVFGTSFLNFSPQGTIVHAKMVSTWLVDAVMLTAAGFAALTFFNGVKRFLCDIHQNALAEGKTAKQTIEAAGFIQALIRTVPTILKHAKFNECTENKERGVSHLLVLFAFIGLFIVTSIFFVAIYGLQIHGPYSQLNPVKWLANISGVALIVGSILLIKTRMSKPDQVSAYKDWLLLGLVLGLGVTGMGAQLTRLAGWAVPSYTIYFMHLILIWFTFAYLPFSKLAHLVYRTVAMTYAEYAGRK
ncbi:MAG: quinone-interacting membrane-bound oxidoreductase complex subunit QmoC [Desulfobacterales bacterium]|nr:quinone-interacting membrane-bound oxidoreductase complex subunit QmoC [Desulfobacterales bacterium]